MNLKFKKNVKIEDTYYLSTQFVCEPVHLDARQASLLATLPVLRITYQSCSLRSPPSAAFSANTLTKNVHKFEGCRC